VAISRPAARQRGAVRALQRAHGAHHVFYRHFMGQASLQLPHSLQRQTSSLASSLGVLAQDEAHTSAAFLGSNRSARPHALPHW